MHGMLPQGREDREKRKLAIGAKISGLLDQGLQIQHIAERLGMTKSAVCQYTSPTGLHHDYLRRATWQRHSG